MNKICTSIVQSKKLIELGIDVNTANMCYRIVAYNPDDTHVYQPYCFVGTLESDIPAWSLSALLELMPRIEHLKPFIDLSPNLDSEEVAIYYHSEDSPYIVKDNLIDTAFEMVCWLIENNYIKTNKQ